jgi:hypothetical protein
MRSGGTLSQEEIAAEERTRDQIQACMLIFWEIAAQLSEGQQVDRSLRCEETNLPLLVVSREMICASAILDRRLWD